MPTAYRPSGAISPARRTGSGLRMSGAMNQPSPRPAGGGWQERQPRMNHANRAIDRLR